MTRRMKRVRQLMEHGMKFKQAYRVAMEEERKRSKATADKKPRQKRST